MLTLLYYHPNQRIAVIEYINISNRYIYASFTKPYILYISIWSKRYLAKNTRLKLIKWKAAYATFAFQTNKVEGGLRHLRFFYNASFYICFLCFIFNMLLEDLFSWFRFSSYVIIKLRHDSSLDRVAVANIFYVFHFEVVNHKLAVAIAVASNGKTVK